MYIADVPTQLKNIMPAAGLGFALGLVYEFIRILRLYISSGKIFVFVSDFLFTVFASVSVFMLFVAVDNGHIRFYMIISCVLGYVVCLFSAGEMLYSFFARIHLVLMRIFRFIFRPFVLIFNKITALFEKISEKTEKFKNKFKKHLKHDDEVLYNTTD